MKLYLFNKKKQLKVPVDYFIKEKSVITNFMVRQGLEKPTIVKFIMKKLKISNKQLLFTTFTGRASLMLRKKGN